MEDNLFPVGYESETIGEDDSTSEVVGYRGGASFSFENGDYKMDGRNRIRDADGIESWKSWCIICLSTERYKHLAVSSDFGIDMDAIMRSETREEAESMFSREAIEALLADPYQRTQYVEDIEFDWPQPDTMAAHLTVRGIDGVSIDLDASVTKNR